MATTQLAARGSEGDAFLIPWHSPKGQTMLITCFKASNILGQQTSLVNWQFECQGMIILSTPKFQLSSYCTKISFLILDQFFCTLSYAGSCAEILVQYTCYAGHVDDNMDFSSLASE